MATQKEIATDVAAATARIVSLQAQITKIGGETQTLKDRIADLENSLPDNASAELTDAVTALKEQLGVLETATQATDDKVPDAPPPTP